MLTIFGKGSRRLSEIPHVLLVYSGTSLWKRGLELLEGNFFSFFLLFFPSVRLFIQNLKTYTISRSSTVYLHNPDEQLYKFLNEQIFSTMSALIL